MMFGRKRLKRRKKLKRMRLAIVHGLPRYRGIADVGRPESELTPETFARLRTIRLE